MLKVILQGHDKFYGITDIVRMFYGDVSEDRENSCVTAGEGPDLTLVNTLEEDGRSLPSRPKAASVMPLKALRWSPDAK